MGARTMLTRTRSHSRSRHLAPVLAGVLALGLAAVAPAQDVTPKSAPQSAPVVITNAAIFPVSSQPIPDGTLIAENGVITYVGPTTEAPPNPEGATVVDAQQRRLYPGLVAANTIMGLMEIASVRGTMDSSEVGDVTPEARAIAAVNPDSTLIPVTRSAGVLTACTMPLGGLVPGRAAVIRLAGWTWEEMAIEADAALCLNWPTLRPIQAWWMTDSAQVQLDRTADQLRAIADYFDAAEAYAAARAADPATPADVRFEAMLPAMRGESQVFIRANELDQIRSAATFCVDRGLRGVIVGGADADACADLLVRHDIGVILTGTHRLPTNRHDGYDESFTLPARLEEAGVRWCLASNGGSFDTPHERNLPYHAAIAVAHGLDEEVALRSITRSAAELLGVGDRLGTLEVGKAATMFLADGDVLEVTTNVSDAWIDGRTMILDDKHKQLDRKYRERYRQLNGG
jgi:imidazolonepropionase-like amidohydrolase